MIETMLLREVQYSVQELILIVQSLRQATSVWMIPTEGQGRRRGLRGSQ